MIYTHTSGWLSVVADPVHQGRTSQLWAVRIARVGDDKLVARGSVRLQHVEAPDPGASASDVSRAWEVSEMRRADARTVRRLASGCAWVGALFFALGGVWALAAPHSFFQVIAPYPPYSRH